MKRIFRPTLLSVALLLAAGAQAEGQAPEATLEQNSIVQVSNASPSEEEAIDSEAASAAAPMPMDPGMVLMEQIEAWKNGPGAGLAARADSGQLFMGEGMAVVKSSPQSPDWADHRLMAYKEAMMQAQAQFIEWEGISAKAEAVSRFFDDRTKMPKFDPEELQNTSKIEELLSKAMAVTSGTLDEKLHDLGIDPEQFKAVTPEKRARMLEDSVSEKVRTSARAALTGFVPVKTFEANDSEGRHAIAVVAIASNKMRQFVYDMKSSRGDLAPEPAKASKVSLKELFSQDKTSLINEFGIRKMYDENGYPVLVSFGQSGTGYNGSDFKRQMEARKGAFLYAKNEAYANFAYLLNSTGTSTQESSKKSINSTDGIATLEDGSVVESEESRTELIRQINNEIVARGSIKNLPGTRQLLRWTVKHPQYGNEIDGVIYVWHPQSELNAREMKNFKPTKQVKAKAVEQHTSGNAGTAQSRDLMSADDF